MSDMNSVDQRGTSRIKPILAIVQSDIVHTYIPIGTPRMEARASRVFQTSQLSDTFIRG